ncbi:MAG: sugar phosphate isomerase/epimerase [Gammaproteobacteria bacterium]|nr:sugar phosphate isomerase/epimerase [Gammaproteobacteria bacterium]
MENRWADERYNVPFATSYALQEYLSAENGLFEAKKANYTHWYIDGSLEENLPDTWGIKRITALQDSIDKLNVRPIFHGNYKLPLASDVNILRKTAIEYVKKEIDLASHFHAPIIIHGGAVVEPRLINKTKQLAINNYLHSILDLIEYSQNKNVEIYLENLSNYKDYKPFHYIFSHMPEFEYIFDRIQNVKFFLDIGHANICDGSPVEIIKKYHTKIVAMSFSNNDGKRDQHLRLNKGTIDYKQIISIILACQWKGMVAFETRGISPEQSVYDLFNLYQDVIQHRI